jgi:hypothetical protein
MRRRRHRRATKFYGSVCVCVCVYLCYRTKERAAFAFVAATISFGPVHRSECLSHSALSFFVVTILLRCRCRKKEQATREQSTSEFHQPQTGKLKNIYVAKDPPVFKSLKFVNINTLIFFWRQRFYALLIHNKQPIHAPSNLQRSLFVCSCLKVMIVVAL